jgi:hypothetical protein
MDHEQKIWVYYCQLNPINLNKNKIEFFYSKRILKNKPSSVYILIEKPRGSRTVSAEPLSPARKIEDSHSSYYIFTKMIMSS